MTVVTIESLLRALGGEKGGNGILCPAPGHSARDRGMRVWPDPTDSQGFRVHLFNGDDWQSAKNHVSRALGMEGWRPGPRLSPQPQAPVPSGGMDRFRRIDLARSIYDDSVPTPGTPVDLYLAGRCVSAPDVLRFHPQCLFGQERRPAMVAPMVDIHTNRFRGVHRTPLTSDGKKTGDRLMLGQAAGAVVKLSADEEVTTVLGIGEGIETTLSLSMLPESFGIPVWGCLSATALGSFPVLAGVEVLWIAVDNDPSGTGEREAQRCADRWTAAGCEVWLQTPNAVRSDLNDVIKEYRNAG